MQLPDELVIDFLQKKEADILKIAPLKQRGENTCWATCYEMVDRWRQVFRNSCEYVNLQTKHCTECYRPNAACDRPRPVADVTLDWWTLGYAKTKSRECNLDEDEIREATRNGRPVQAFIKFRDKAVGHYVLIVGLERRSFTGDVLIAIIDPQTGYNTKSYGELFKWGNWQYSWVVH